MLFPLHIKLDSLPCSSLFSTYLLECGVVIYQNTFIFPTLSLSLPSRTFSMLYNVSGRTHTISITRCSLSLYLTFTLTLSPFLPSPLSIYKPTFHLLSCCFNNMFNNCCSTFFFFFFTFLRLAFGLFVHSQSLRRSCERHESM